MKIYELANEFDVSSLSLVEMARKWGVMVRNHMVDMGPDLESRFRYYLIGYRKFGNRKNFEKKTILLKKKKNLKSFDTPVYSKFAALLPNYIWDEIRFRIRLGQVVGGWKFEEEMERFYQIKKIVLQEAV